MGNAQGANKGLLGVVGVIALVVGLTLVLVWWPDVMVLFRGILGIVLAVAGLFILYIIRQ